MLLELEHINKDYQQDQLIVPALRDVSFYVEKGDYLAIMGPSGSGKSTLMNILGCLDLPTSGKYHLDGTDILALSDNELSEIRCHKIGFVFQSFQLLSQETAVQNVMLPLSFAGVKRKDRREIAEKALARVGLSDRVDFYPSQLSGGQKQRVAIARALVNDPEIILADEPTGALDQKSGAQVMDLFERLNQEGVTVIIITHDANVGKRARKIMHIVDGEIDWLTPDGSQLKSFEVSEDGEERLVAPADGAAASLPAPEESDVTCAHLEAPEEGAEEEELFGQEEEAEELSDEAEEAGELSGQAEEQVSELAGEAGEAAHSGESQEAGPVFLSEETEEASPSPAEVSSFYGTPEESLVPEAVTNNEEDPASGLGGGYFEVLSYESGVKDID